MSSKDGFRSTTSILLEYRSRTLAHLEIPPQRSNVRPFVFPRFLFRNRLITSKSDCDESGSQAIVLIVGSFLVQYFSLLAVQGDASFQMR